MDLQFANCEKTGPRRCLDHRRRQHECTQNQTYLLPYKNIYISPIISALVFFLFFISSVCPVRSVNFNDTDQDFRPRKLKFIRAHLAKVNKPAVKTIQSPDGDIIDCVPSHKQPAFDHPKLKGQKPLDPPDRPKGQKSRTVFQENQENFQVWSMSNEFCPEGSIPIRRTREKDVLRASSIRQFGKKLRQVRRDTSSNGHEHAVGYVSGDEYYGAKASLNVWAPVVANQYEFSLSQMWVIAGSFGDDLNTIEAGWQVSPELYGDNYPRFFTYWTSDAYQATGCYNLLCSGFVQTNNKIAIGAAISPTSAYNGGQFDISLLVWKDPKHGNWWLEFGNGILVGYWPSFLFTHLRDHASMVQFGGEIVNSESSSSHTSTQMGSGHFAGEGFGKASYFRNLQIVDWDNNLVPLSNLRVLADHPNCYDIQGGINKVWGNYFYYGGPGKNSKCP
ncbi:carboxyl-terminal peptidase [Perilla frutescens var. hirtella]|uniref:Carboxyl-terminal peptidase n=1 Tax=Perilla frutescens var. hirtella TaxID=608512 RepID=A0AAD4J6G0_PERFH|nr:carboxyl-terminal peptidase [Perilla frutescens var. hirtella]